MTDVGFLKWKDPYEWTEESRTRFKIAIQKEVRLSGATVSFLSNRGELEAIKAKFLLAEKDHSDRLTWSFPFITVIPIFEGTGGYEFKLDRVPSKLYECDDLDISLAEKVVAYTTEVGKMDFKLHVRDHTGKLLWTGPKMGGAEVCILGSYVFFLETVTPLNYARLVRMDLKTGYNRRVIYEEADREMTVELVKTGLHSLFLLGYRSGVQTLRSVEKSGVVKRLSPDGVAFFPVGAVDGETVYFVRERSFSSPWVVRGCLWKLGSEIPMEGIEYCEPRLGILITKFYGMRKIWKLSTRQGPKLLHQGFFTVEENPWDYLYGPRDTLALDLVIPGNSLVPAEIDKSGEIRIGRPSYQYAEMADGIATSYDSVPVRWLLLQNSFEVEPIGLMVVAYGAYGLCLPLNTTRWRPWIERGWAVALVFVRGGGDGNEMWADMGRRQGRSNVVDDFEVSCRALQKKTGCGPERTCIFGRSAGGLIVGGIAGRHPEGDLAGMIYAEAPYVDLLKTAANPKFQPLTEFEYGEFGNPAKDPSHFEDALNISPIHQLGPKGAPGIRVVCRTGLNDVQVLPHEPLKWILTLRGKRKGVDGKYLFAGNEGHHSSGNFLVQERAVDFLLINSFLES